MNGRILITGSEGLIGAALRNALEADGARVAGLDLRGPGGEEGDTRDARRVRDAVSGCRGVVHLAAVSRVAWGERDPDACFATNVGGTGNVVAAMAAERARSPRGPWLLFASSREAYGHAGRLPVAEDAPLRPINVYGRTKVEGERLAMAARDSGLRTAVARLSNVYGSTRDHADRVVPAFARAAALGGLLRVEGEDSAFDFTHIDDTVRGLTALIGRLDGGEAPPPAHLVTGRSTSLGELAALAVELAGTGAPIARTAPRSFDVARFHGDPARARELLGWTARTPLRRGLARLIGDFRAELGIFERKGAA